MPSERRRHHADANLVIVDRREGAVVVAIAHYLTQLPRVQHLYLLNSPLGSISRHTAPHYQARLCPQTG